METDQGQGSKATIGGTDAMSVVTARMVALLLIELVSPDVMYNGIQWPEEDFMKVTVERFVSA